MPNALTIKLNMSGLAQVQAGLASLGSGITKFAAPLAAAAGAGLTIKGIVDGFKSMVDLGGRLNDTSIKTGIAVARMLQLESAVKDVGGAAEDASRYVNLLQKRIAEAAQSGKEGAFGKMGLAVRDLVGMDAGELFETVLKAMAALPDATQRSAAAMSIFGRSGTAVLPLIEGGVLRLGEGLGRLPELMQRNAKEIDFLGDAWERSGVKSQQFFAGVFDVLSDSSTGIVAWFNNIDLTGFGQRVGAFLRVGVESAKEGKFSDFLALAVEIGIVKGVQAAKLAWDLIADSLSSPDLFYGLTQTAVLFFEKFVLAAYAFNRVLATGLETIALKWEDMMYRIVARVVVKMLEPFKSLPGWMGKTAETLQKAHEKLVTAAPMTWTAAFEEAKRRNTEMYQAFEKQVQDVRDFTLSWWADFWAAGVDGSKTLEERLKELEARMQGLIAKRNAIGAGAGGAGSPGGGLETSMNTLDAERAVKEKIRSLDADIAAIENDFSKTYAEKWGVRRRLLQEEQAELQKIVDYLQLKADLTDNPDEERKILADKAGYQQQLYGVEDRLGGMGANSYSPIDQATVAITGLRESIGTLAEDIGKVITVMGDGFKSLADSTYELMIGTARIGEVWLKVGQTAIKSILSIASQYIASKLAMMAVNAIAAKRQQAENVASMATSIPAGVAESGAMGGWVGVLTYIGVFAAAMAAITALAGAAGGGFKSGGYTGDGGPSSVAGAVHGREFVFDAPATALWTPELLEGMRRGEVRPTDLAGAGGTAINIATFDSKLDARKWASSQEEETWFVDMALRTAHRWRA